MRVFKTMPIIAMLFVMVTRVSAQTEMNDSIMSGRQINVDEMNMPLADSSLYAREPFIQKVNHGVGSTDHFLR